MFKDIEISECEVKKMKKIITLLMALMMLCACSFESGSISMVSNNNNVTITANNAGTDSSTDVTLDVDGGEIELDAAADLESGTIRLAFYENTGDDTVAEGAEALYYVDLQGTDTAVITCSEGNYIMLATVLEKATGTINIVITEPAEEEQNPIMNFAGTYAAGRCAIDVIPGDDDDTVYFDILWGSSAAETTEWTMSGTFDPDTLTVTYDDAVRTDLVFNENGDVESSEVVYENGTGTFQFYEDMTLTWADDVEGAADDVVFEFANYAE